MAGILIIGDNLLIRTLLREILRDAGYEVLGEFKTGPAAMASVLDLRPDLVILDIVLVRHGGLATVRDLRTIDRALEVIVCAARLERGNAIAALKIGVSGFIMKPFDSKAVLDAVHEALRHVAASSSPAAWNPGTPLSGPPGGAADEHRDFVRLQAALPVAIDAEDGTQLDTVTVDVSGGGILLAGGPLTLGTAVAFRLDLCTGEAPIAGSARVVRITEDGLPALEFAQVHIADHERLTAYIAGHDPGAPRESSRHALQRD